jgi:hypothetical protein
MMRLLRWMPAALIALALLIVGGARALERFGGVEVQLIVPASDEEVALNRSLWTEGEPVTAVYGVPAGEPVQVLFIDETRILRPEEDPGLALLPVDKQAGDNPLQV